MAGNFGKQGIEIDADAILAGLKDAMAGKPSALSAEDTQNTMMQLQQEMEQKFQEKAGKAGEANKKSSVRFSFSSTSNSGTTSAPVIPNVIIKSRGKSN